METTDSNSPDLTNVVIRPLLPGDEATLKEFNASLSEESRGRFLPHAYDDATLTRMIVRATQGIDRAFMAMEGDCPVGYCFLWDIADSVPVLGIGLTDAWQGRGLGRRLMTHLIDEARAAGCAGIELTTVPENERAFALYQKVGFTYLGDTDNSAGDGRVVRERMMFLPLKPGAQPPQRSFGPPV